MSLVEIITLFNVARVDVLTVVMGVENRWHRHEACCKEAEQRQLKYSLNRRCPCGPGQ